MLYLGLVLGVVAGNLAAHRAGINAARCYVATLILIAAALLGARLLFVVTHWTFYKNDLRRIWDRREGGFSMYGGLPVALLVSVPLLRLVQLPFGGFWDVGGITILVGMIFARTGCLLSGCCAGRRSSGRFTAHLPNSAGVWAQRVPSQVFEALWAATLLLIAIQVWRWMPFQGALFLLISFGYASGRLVLDVARERETTVSGFSLAQKISAVTSALSFSVLVLYWRG